MWNFNIDVENVYINLILTSISRKCDFSQIIIEAEERVQNKLTEQENNFLPKGYEGLFFVELAARMMGSSLGEVYNLCAERKEEILYELFENTDLSNSEDYFDDNSLEGIIEFEMCVPVLCTTDEKTFFEYYRNLMSQTNQKNNELYTYYNFIFRKFDKDVIETENTYSILLEKDKGFHSDYIYNSFEVWTGNEGYFAEFIEKVIDKHNISNNLGLPSEYINNEVADNESVAVEQHNTSNDKIIVDKPVIESEEPKVGTKIAEELVKYIFNDTKTVELLDKFEGIGQQNERKYKRLVIENGKYFQISGGEIVYFNLVIERGRGSDYVGDITFTEFKKGEDSELRAHIFSEITDEIISCYKDKDQFYRFSKPYLLRAQNSSNRTGYGWEWDWSGGYGDYIEGTLYGETTNYFFVGAYITTGYTYDAKNRKPFDKETETSGIPQKFEVIFYDGKLKHITQNITKHKFLKINADSGIKYVPIAYDEAEKVLYVNKVNGNKFKEIILSGRYEVKNNYGE